MPINALALKTLLSYHESQVRAWELVLKNQKSDQPWGKDALLHHKERCRELRDLLKLVSETK